MVVYHEYCGGTGAVLNTIVMAGTHDAGITDGKGYARTQTYDIAGQAKRGVRVFDLRIAAATSGGKEQGVKKAELRAYHADGAAKKNETKTRYLTDIGQNVQIDRSKIRVGTFGESLQTILAQAEAFVGANKTEFLILKFDKCLNWRLVAEACVTLLSPGVIYKAGGNINLKTLGDMKGKVVCAFTDDGLTALNGHFGPADGIVGFHNVNGGAPYQDVFDGIQYYGKGGTSLMGLKPVKENRKKQAGLMKAGVQSHAQALGMMYWTSTGLIGDIKKRDKSMWTRTNRKSLQDTWENGLKASIDDRIDKNLSALGAGGTLMKTFMPNIVMIDFADYHKCHAIMELNRVAGHELAALARSDADLVELDF